MKYSFEEWGEQADKTNPDKMKWSSPLPLDELATANNGVAYLKAFDFTNKYNYWKKKKLVIKVLQLS